MTFDLNYLQEMETDVSMAISEDRTQWYSKDFSMRTAEQSRPSLFRRTPTFSSGGKGSGSGLRRFSAPSGISESESDSDSDGPRPSFSMQAPDYSTDFVDEEDGGEVTSKPYRSFTPRPRISPAQEALYSLHAKLNVQLLVSAQHKSNDFQRQIQQIDSTEKAKLLEIKSRLLRRQEVEAGADEALRVQQGAGKRQMMAGLQQEHNSQAQVMDAQAHEAHKLEEEKKSKEKKKEEAVRQAKLELQAKEEAEKQRKREEEEAERLAKHEQAKAAEVQARALEKEQDADRRERSAAEGPSTSGQAAGVRTLPEAAEFESHCQKVLKEQQALLAQLKSDKGKSSERRDLDKSINKLVGQIGGTQEQVNIKTTDLLKLLSGLDPNMMAFAFLRLSDSFLDLAEGSDSRFAVAEVATAIGNQHPTFVAVLLAKLHKACPLSLPKAMVKLKQESQDEYFKRWGYRRVEQWDKKLKKRVEDWEEVDVYLRRVTALVHFYAAFVQSDQQKVHGMEHGWSYLARLLNLCHPSRYTAFALTAFVEIAGYRLYLVFRAQAMKLLEFIWFDFLGGLAQKNSKEAASAVSRLTQYLQDQRWLQPPPGRELEMFDASTYDRA